MTPERGDVVGIEVIPGVKHVGVVVNWGIKSYGRFWIVLRHLKALNDNRDLYINLNHVICYQRLEADKVDLNQYGPQPPKKEPSKPNNPIKFEKPPEIDNVTYNGKVRVMKLAELHKEKISLEKEEIKARLSKKDLSGVKNVEYTMPSFKKRT